MVKVVITLSLAPVPKTVAFVIVKVPVPPPENPVDALTISPCLDDPVPPVKTEIVKSFSL